MKRPFFIPEFLPQLRRGAGDGPENGGCFVQVCSYLWDGHWTDGGDEHGYTDCMNGFIRSKGIEVNDGLSDTSRQRMWMLMPRALGTADDVNSWDLENSWDKWWDEHQDDEGSSADLSIAALTALIDKYYELAGREPEGVSPDRWAALGEVFSGKEVQVKDGTCTVGAH